MTAQDWLLELHEDEDRSEAASRRRRRWLAAGALTAVLVVAAGLIWGTDLSSGGPAAVRPAPSAASGNSAASPAPRPVLIQAGLTDPALANDTQTGPLTVTAEPLQGGFSPDRVPDFDSCQADPATLQYLPVRISVRADYLSAMFEVQTTASTPPGIGRLGFFFQSGGGSTPCPGGAWPTSDSFLANLSQTHITGYVVLDQAFTPSTPQGRADVLRSLRLRVSDVRVSGRPATIAAPSIGSLCPGTQNELCASLG
jgi:hypothetical protein